MDLRVYSTKARIMDGLFKCIKEKPFSNVLNQDIIAKAEISSRTFYRHYSNKTQVIQEFEDKFADGLSNAFAKDRHVLTNLGAKPSKVDILNVADASLHYTMLFCDEYKKEGKLLLSPHGDIRFSWIIRKTSEKEFSIRAQYLYGIEEINPNNIDDYSLVQKIYVGGIVSAIETWLTYSDEVSPQAAKKILGEMQVFSPLEMIQKVNSQN